MSTTKFVLSIVAALSLAACESTTNTAKTVSKPQPAATSTPVAATKAAAPTTIQLSDGTYQGTIAGSTITLVIRNGRPVSYTTPDYVATSVSRTGDVINIDKAKMSVSSADSSRMNIRWRLGSYRTSSVLTKVSG